MTKVKRLTKHGNSYALIIDRPILDLLGINNNTLLQIFTPDGESIVIKPIKSKGHKPKIAAALIDN